MWFISIFITIGAFISHVIVFYLAREKLHKLVKPRPSAISKSHWFHKYGVFTMFFIPSISIFIPPLIDTLMIPLGHYRVNVMKLFAVVFVGELIRAYFIGTMLINLL